MSTDLSDRGFGIDGSLHSSNEEVSADSSEIPLQDSQVLITETDVTLPWSLDGNCEFHEMNQERESQWAGLFPDSCGSSSLLVKVYQEMMIIYKQLKAERQSQQQRERLLQERERRLKQQEEAFGRLAGLEEMVHSRILAIEEKHQQDLMEQRHLLQEKNKENKRLKSNFDTIKELNDNMRKQLTEISEQNKRLESRSKRLQARLENLQRKYQQYTTLRACQMGNGIGTVCIKPHIKEKTFASGKPSNKGSLSTIQLKLLELLLEWVLDGQMFSVGAGNEMKDAAQHLPPEVVLDERCLKALPLLADQLHDAPQMEPNLLLHLLRLIYWALRHLENSKQQASLPATLRRIGEGLSKPAVLPCKDPDFFLSCTEAAGGIISQKACPHTRILSNLIILLTTTQADVTAQALDSLNTELKCEESRGLYIHYEGVHALLSVLRSGRARLHTAINILMQLAEQSRYFKPFLKACSCEEFFRTISQLLKNPHLELPSLEKLSILLQKLSSIRKNHHLFECSSLHLHIQELHHKTDARHTFLHLNLRATLHNLK
ncbi:coiled-coil domain-containing protein 138-like [Cololabis saira]|uniref:coiled-coil domain-containing protein 138-like n=1 Tax=Cololabis saira TaxID=129043 RepID=UPI002AD277B7|nr:coiled-coil domain-containing protein 138-like [Cololabis saira]